MKPGIAECTFFMLEKLQTIYKSAPKGALLIKEVEKDSITILET